MFRWFFLVLCFEACRSQSSCPDTCGNAYWNKGKCSNGKMQACACRELVRDSSSVARLSDMGARTQGKCPQARHDVQERSAINQLRDQTLALLRDDIQNGHLRYSDFCRYMQIPLDLVSRAYMTNIELFKDDLTTAVPSADVTSAFDIFLSIFLVVLNAVPIFGAQAEALAKLSTAPEITKFLEKLAEKTNDVDSLVLTVDAAALTYGLESMKNAAASNTNKEAFTVDVIDFVADLYRGRQLTELKFIAAMHAKIAKLYKAFNIPQTLTKSSSNRIRHQTLLEFHLSKAFDSIQTQAESYRTLLSNYFNSAGIGFMVRRDMLNGGKYDWSIAGIPEEIKNRFMERLLEYTDGCLKPSQQMIDANGVPVGVALFVKERPNRVIFNQVVSATRGQDVIIRKGDEKTFGASDFCNHNRIPRFSEKDAAQKNLQKFMADSEQKKGVAVSHARAPAYVPWIMHAAVFMVVWFQHILND